MKYASACAILVSLLIGGCYLLDRDIPAACGKTAKWPLPDDIGFLSQHPDSGMIEMQVTAATARVNTLAETVEGLCRLRGHYPATLAELPEAGADGTVRPRCVEFLSDPWEQPFVYRLRDSVPEFVSAGHDGVFGSEDDIRSARPGDMDATPIGGRNRCLLRR